MTILDNESVRVALQQAGRAHGIVDDPDVWRLADLSAVSIGADGSVAGIAEAVAKLKEAKPYLAPRRDARLMAESDRIAALKEIIRRSENPRRAPAPVVTNGKTAKDMSPKERTETLAAIRRRHA